MRSFRGPIVLPAEARGAVVAIGNFDGLHRGHQALFERVRVVAGRRQVLRGVLTFSPHPVRVLAPELAPPLILREDEKERGVAAAGMDVYIVEPFDAAVAALSPRAFCEEVLVRRLGVSGVVIGEGFRFGHKAEGTVLSLREALEPAGCSVDVVAPVGEGGLVCSSTKIRQVVLEGKVEAAAVLLGQPYFVEGVVVRGDARGRQLGIPTANLETGRELLPRVGVYASRTTLVDGRTFASVTNVGLRPTFAGQGVRVETHLLDFAGDLYEQRLRVELVARIRDEQRFSGVEALLTQIHSDIEAARAVLSSR